MTKKMIKKELPEMNTTIIHPEEQKKRLAKYYKKISNKMGSQMKEGGKQL